MHFDYTSFFDKIQEKLTFSIIKICIFSIFQFVFQTFIKYIPGAFFLTEKEKIKIKKIFQKSVDIFNFLWYYIQAVKRKTKNKNEIEM